jgi:hypothetical protein
MYRVPPGLHWLTKIISTLRLRYRSLNPHYETHYEAAWTESWTHHRCLHEHPTLIEAAKCAVPHGAVWYVVAVDEYGPRQLTDAEDEVVNEFRFGAKKS